MIVKSEEIEVASGEGKMRVLLTRPTAEGRFPAVLMYSDIFQITAPQLRVSRRLAGYGFIVATPEIWHRREPRGTAIPFDDEGRTRGLANARETSIAEHDADARAVLDRLAKESDRLGVVGFCIGGHLAFRAAFQPDVRAAVCFYPTGVHDGKLGKDADAGSLARVDEIRGELLLVLGTHDPHVPEAARATLAGALAPLGKRLTTRLYEAEHAFMRDEGPRYDPEATDAAWTEMVTVLRRALI